MCWPVGGQKGVLVVISGPKGGEDEVTGVEETARSFCTKYCSDDQISTRWAGHVACEGDKRNLCRFYLETLKRRDRGKRSRCLWWYNIN